MKRLIFIFSLSMAFIVICLGSAFGMRLGPCMCRAGLVFLASTVFGWLVALVSVASLFTAGDNQTFQSNAKKTEKPRKEE